MSVTQPVPSREAFLVEFPGYVRNYQAAVNTLGGVDALTKAASSDDSVLQLRFRPDDPYAHPLYGERQAARGLLLKIARKVADPSQGGVKAEVLACVNSKFTFSGMADYQYLPVDPSKSGKASSTTMGPYGEETQPLLCVPPLFTKADVPLDYAFKNFRASDRPASGRAKQPPWLIPYTAQQVPAQVASDAQPGKVISHAHTFHDSQLKPKNKSSKCMCLPETGTEGIVNLVTALQTHLSLRPIWTQAFMTQQTPETPQADLELQLQKLCYQFKEGPWTGAWVRRGHDPRTDPNSLQYQTLEYVLPAEWYAKLSANQSNAAAGSSNGSALQLNVAAAHGHSFEEVHRFEALPTAQKTEFQLCDLAHPELQELLQSCSHTDECSQESGWLSKASLDRIVSKVTQLFARHIS